MTTPVETNIGCSICICDFEKKDQLVKIPCGHVFHQYTCLDEWLKKNNTCPTCRAPNNSLPSTKKISKFSEDFKRALGILNSPEFKKVKNVVFGATTMRFLFLYTKNPKQILSHLKVVKEAAYFLAAVSIVLIAIRALQLCFSNNDPNVYFNFDPDDLSPFELSKKSASNPS